MSVPDPNTEKEVFLAKAAGASETLPLTNNTREEIYLRAIAQGGGGGGGSDLPEVTSADEGKVLKVNASGEWATGQDDGERFVITLTQSGSGMVADKTFAEIKAAYEAGKTCVVRYTYNSALLIPVEVSATLTSATITTYSGYDVAYFVFTSGEIRKDSSYTYVTYTYSTIPSRPVDEWAISYVNEAPYPSGGVGDKATDTIGVVYWTEADNVNISVKTYDTTGNNTDGTMTQAAITNAISEANPYYKIDTTTASLHSTFRAGFTALFNSVLASAVAAVGTRVSSASSFSCTSVTNLLALCLGISPKVPQLLVTAASQTMVLFLSSQYYNHYFFRAFIPYNDGTDDYNVDCMFMIDPAGMTIAMTAYAA